MTDKFTYQYCGICGYTPHGEFSPMNILSRWWDPDDGWKFGALCYGCKKEFGDVKPQEGDYAYVSEYIIKDKNILTDEDILDLLE